MTQIDDKKRLKVLPTVESFDANVENVYESNRQRKKRLDEIYSSKPILIIKNLSKYYNTAKNIFKSKKDFQALNNINLELYKGETLGLIGESGSGKTTLSNAILKIHNFEKGEITLVTAEKNKSLIKGNKKLADQCPACKYKYEDDSQLCPECGSSRPMVKK